MEIRNLSFKYGSQFVLQSISADIAQGKITTILGPNGCGKSTLLHLMTKNLKPLSGGVYLQGKNIKDIRLKDFSKKAAIVHQCNTAPQDIKVKTLVAYGRVPYLSMYKKNSEEDEEIVEWAMKITNIYQMKDKEVGTLSGGQRQRVFIAMALAQKTKILFLDEPTTYLDVGYQVQILNLIQNLNKTLGMTIVMILHDINQAIHYSDQVIGLKGGRIIAKGDTETIINSQTLYGLFDINLKVLKEKDRSYVLPISEESELLYG
jgi:iron complex transport system ATP-binding protein